MPPKLMEAFAFIAIALVVAALLVALICVWVHKRHIVIVWNNDLWEQFLARCVCGEPIHGCMHRGGVPSTWEHNVDNSHWHYNEDGDIVSMVEHA
jgi:hypothetical protein